MLSDHVQFQTVCRHHPEIAANLELLWGNPEFAQYINRLFNDGRQGKRQGFAPEVAAALLWLEERHDQEFPQLAAKSTDIWPSSDSSDRY
jgi:hypothetical protein